MIRTLLLTCAISAAYGIIVKDPPSSGLEYKYSYNIDDPTTGDSKSQHEVRKGDVVSGSYTVVDPDGTKRTVDYIADPTKGFNAVVRTEPAESQAYTPTRNDIDTGYPYAQVLPKALYAAAPQQVQYQQAPQDYEEALRAQQQYQSTGPQTFQDDSQPQQYETPQQPSQQPPQYAQAPIYTKTNYQQEAQPVYFTPSNEIVPESNPFQDGQYFLPAQTN